MYVVLCANGIEEGDQILSLTISLCSSYMRRGGDMSCVIGWYCLCCGDAVLVFVLIDRWIDRETNRQTDR